MSSFYITKATHIFSAKNFSIFACHSMQILTNLLTNDIVSFEQLTQKFSITSTVAKHSEKGIHSKRKEFAPKGSKFLPSRVDPIQKGDKTMLVG